jgi:uncharacterized lipoprotein YmbA
MISTGIGGAGRFGAFLLVSLGLAACAGTTTRENYYTLSAPASAAPLPTGMSPSVFVGPVSVPEAVDRTPLVLRTSANQVEISDSERWAEPLKSAIPRVLAEVISRELGTQRVMASRQVNPLPVDYRVAVEIQRFDSSLAEGATLDAMWTVTGAKLPAPRVGRTLAQEPAASRDAAALAAAHSRALARLGRDIAAAMK